MFDQPFLNSFRERDKKKSMLTHNFNKDVRLYHPSRTITCPVIAKKTLANF